MLRFSPTAWAKLLYFRDLDDVEIGGFGITSNEDLLRIEDFQTVKQEVTGASVIFDDASVADYFETQVDAGKQPEEFGRIWLHTHPGSSPIPSSTDEETFDRVFGVCSWALMFILAEGGATYARLRFGAGPGGEIQIPVEVDYSQEFEASSQSDWEQEYDTNIQAVDYITSLGLSLYDEMIIEEDLEDLEDDMPYFWAAREMGDYFLSPEECREAINEITGFVD